MQPDKKTIDIYLRPGVNIWGPGPDGRASVCLAGDGTRHTVPLELGWTLIHEGRATAADADELTAVNEQLAQQRIKDRVL